MQKNHICLNHWVLPALFQFWWHKQELGQCLEYLIFEYLSCFFFFFDVLAQGLQRSDVGSKLWPQCWPRLAPFPPKQPHVTSHWRTRHFCFSLAQGCADADKPTPHPSIFAPLPAQSEDVAVTTGRSASISPCGCEDPHCVWVLKRPMGCAGGHAGFVC